jgi:hypothetical protein
VAARQVALLLPAQPLDQHHIVLRAWACVGVVRQRCCWTVARRCRVWRSALRRARQAAPGGKHSTCARPASPAAADAHLRLPAACPLGATPAPAVLRCPRGPAAHSKGVAAKSHAQACVAVIAAEE